MTAIDSYRWLSLGLISKTKEVFSDPIALLAPNQARLFVTARLAKS